MCRVLFVSVEVIHPAGMMVVMRCPATGPPVFVQIQNKAFVVGQFRSFLA
jgi:hypothetical protein